MRIHHVLKALAVAALVSLPAMADIDPSELSAMTRKAGAGDAEALARLRGIAEGGDKQAQTLMGNLYALGKGVPKDEAAALQWWTKAAEQGWAVAQYNVAQVHLRAMRQVDDLKLVRRWLEPAAEQGLPEAAVDFAVTFTHKGADWADPVQAFKWFTVGAALALNQGTDGANDRYAIFAYNSMVPLREAMTPAQEKEGHELARAWLDSHGIDSAQERKDMEAFFRRHPQPG